MVLTQSCPVKFQCRLIFFVSKAQDNCEYLHKAQLQILIFTLSCLGHYSTLVGYWTAACPRHLQASGSTLALPLTTFFPKSRGIDKLKWAHF